MKAIYFDHENPEKGYRAVDIEDKLMTYSNLLHCDLIDITMRAIGGKNYNIIVDDEGFYNSPNAISALNPYDRECVLVGSLLIVSGEVDEEGGTLGLKDEEIEQILHNVIPYFYKSDDRTEIRSLLKIDWKRWN